MADNLESYFKKHLKDDNPVEENWNVPSDDVWNKVLPEIQKKRGLFIPWKYFYLSGIVLVAVLAFLFWPFGEELPETKTDNLSAIEEKLKPTESRFSETDEYSVSAKEEYNNTTATASEFTEIKKAGNSAQHADHENLAIPGNDRKTTQDQIEKSDNSSKKTKLTNKPLFGANALGNESTTNKTTVSNEGMSTTSQSNSVYRNDQLTTLPNKSISLLNAPVSGFPLMPDTSNQEIFTLNKPQKKQPFDNKGKFGIGAYYSPTFTSTYLSGNLSKGLLETSNQYLYSGSWGFEVNYFISNRFTLVTGVGRSTIKSVSNSLVDFPYDTSTESSMPSGDKENTSPVPMQTPFGEINTEITYLVPGDTQFPDGEPMQSEMETEQELSYLSIPLGVEFNIIRFSRFSWIFGAGLQYNRALKDATQFNSRILHDGHDMEVMYEQMTSHPTYTRNYLSFYAGTGMSYQFSKSFQLKVSADYFGNITKVNLQDNLSTYVNGFKLNFGIVYIF